MNNKTKIIAGVCLFVGVAAIAVFFLLPRGKNYSISFDTDGGSFEVAQSLKEGSILTRPSDPTKEGYTFVRWEVNGKEYDFTTPIEGDMTLRAIWKKNDVPVQKYKVTFNVDGNTKVVEVASASEINTSNLGFEEKDGYILRWYVDGKEYDLTTALTGDITIDGKYEKATTFTVKFSTDGGTKVSDQKVVKGEKVKEPVDVKKEGYILDGWYLSGKKYDFNSEVTKNITLTAKWSEDPSVTRYEVTFNSDGGSNVAKQRVIENKTATQPKNPTKTGYGFDGWYLDNTKYDFKDKVTKDITLVAKWHELEKFTVTFNSDGGSEVSSQTVYEGSKATKPSNPTKSGYVFKEWQLNQKKYDFSKETVTGNITLVAVWTKDVNKFTVSFNSNGGSSVASQTVNEGSTAKEPTKPTRSGYTFKGWLLNGKTFSFSSAIYGNITLVADWEETVNYTISIEKVDEYSPARIINVYKNGTKITVKGIKAGSDGVMLCSGSNLTVDSSDVKNEKSLIIVLNDGKEVRVNVQ